MTKEELKEKLKGAMYAQRTLEGELDKLQELRNLAQKVTPAYSQSPGGGSGNAQKLENSIAKIIEQEKIIAECCNAQRFSEYWNQICKNILENITDDQRSQHVRQEKNRLQEIFTPNLCIQCTG